MDKNISILIYEKEEDLNSILYEQILDTIDYEVYTSSNKNSFMELANIKEFDICVLNIENIDNDIKPILDTLFEKNKSLDIVGYCDKLNCKSILKDYKIIFVQKPFRFNYLIEMLDNIKLTKKGNNKKILMKHLDFFPNKKILINNNTKIILHLTEKENHLLNYLYNNKNSELTKNHLLINIWGVTEVLNTHTLETHVYRLKQKLLKLEPNLSFSLTNKNGLYSFKYL